jgi:hypothetical protein
MPYYICKEMLQAKEGRDDENPFNLRSRTTIEQENKTQLVNSKPKCSMTHYLRQERLSHITMKAKRLKPKPITKLVAYTYPFSNLWHCHGLFHTKRKELKDHAFISCISKTLKQKQQSKWPANSFKENRKESTLQNQPKYHLNWRGPSLVFFLFLLDRALSRSQAHPM